MPPNGTVGRRRPVCSLKSVPGHLDLDLVRANNAKISRQPNMKLFLQRGERNHQHQPFFSNLPISLRKGIAAFSP